MSSENINNDEATAHTNAAAAEVELLRRAVEGYRARLAEAGELAAHVRHELNNPLTGVLGQTQLLLREDLSERARQRVEVIESLAMRIKDTVALLRDLSRPVEGL